MRWKYRNHVHANGETLVTYFGARRLYTARGFPDRIIKRALVEGEVLATTQAAIESARDTIEAAYAQDGGDAALLTDTGAETYQMRNCRILELAWLQEEAKAHFATALPFRITIESEELASDGGMLSFSESFTRIGNGGPRVVWPELQNGPAIPQTTAANTNVTLIQSGEAVALGGWPLENVPVFPAFLDNPTDTTSRTINFADLRPVYTVRWNYVFTFNRNEPLPFPTAR
jgi:hypothetical protein